MANIKKREPVTTSLEDALNFEDVVAENGGTPNAPAVGEPSEGEEQTTEEHDNNDEVAILRAELEAARELLAAANEAKGKLVHKPVPESELSPEQRQIRELQDQLARANGRKDATLEYEENTEGGILVHFLGQNTFTSNNTSFYYGQEVTFGPEAYKNTIDRFGNSWINMTDEEQYARWGEVKFRKGPWPGRRSYEEDALANVSITTQAPVVSS